MTDKALTTPQKSLQELMNDTRYKSRFQEVLGNRAPAFISSVMSYVATSKGLAEVDQPSIVQAAAVAATLDLPINASLGFAYIVPFKGKAQFQIGWKGFVQLALRSNQYQTINATVVHEGELVGENKFTGDYVFDQSKKTSNKVVGYLLYFRLLNGYEKYFYWTKEQTLAHGKKYSQTYKNGFGVWVENEDAMGLKTVVKLGLTKYGPLSTAFQKAVEADQAVIREDGTPEYVDGDSVEVAPTYAMPKAKEAPAPTPEPVQEAQVVEESDSIEPPAEDSDNVLTFTPAAFSEKPGEKNGKKWVKFGVKTPEGEWIGTFDKDLGAKMKAAKEGGSAIRVTFKVDGAYKTAESVEVA